MTIKQDVLRLSHTARVEFWMLDLTALGGAIHRFCNHVNELGQPVVWQGSAYQPIAFEAKGFEKSGAGPFPRPTVRMGDVTGAIGALARQHQGLAGAKLVRKQTLARYLDAVNFAGGNPSADPGSFFADEFWIIDRKAREDGISIEFTLAAAVDVAGVRIPLRQVIQNICTWDRYRGPECGYIGGPVADENDVPTGNSALDKCGRRMTSCKLRFGNDLPTGAFPTAGLTRV